jgi:hypothetical protein
MSTELQTQVPAPAALLVSEQEAAEFREAYAANIASGSITEFDLQRIKIVNGEALWKIPTLEGSTTAQAIEGVVVLTRDTRAYYPSKELKNQPPDCSSNDGITGTAKAGVNLGGECAKCPMAQWESAPDSGAQACKQSKQLFMVRGTSMLPELVTLPPTSLKPAKQFFLKLTTQRVPHHKCIVRIDLHEASNAAHQKYGKADVKFLRMLSPEEHARALEFRAMAETIAEHVDLRPANE